MGSLELRPEKGRASSWMMLMVLGGASIAVMMPLALVFAAWLGPCGLSFVFALCASALGMMWVGWTRYQLAINQPKPVLTLGSDRIVVGQPIEVSWRFEEGGDRVRGVKLQAIGRETIRHNQPNEGTRERHDAQRVDIAFGSGSTGGGQLLLPERALPTFRAGPVQFDWRLEMSGTLDDDGQLDQRFDIVVHPC